MGWDGVLWRKMDELVKDGVSWQQSVRVCSRQG